MNEFRTFVVPYDFSPHAVAALDAAGNLAKRLGADLHLLHVVHVPMQAYAYAPHPAAAGRIPFDTHELREEARRALEQVAGDLEGLPGRVQAHVVEGVGIADAIGVVAEEQGADLIVMGTHGRTGLAHVFLGSVAERTLRLAPCPVLTVRASEEAQEG